MICPPLSPEESSDTQRSCLIFSPLFKRLFSLHMRRSFQMPINPEVSRSPKAVVVGAGPVGCLSAMALAKLGWDVVMYERRPDSRAGSVHALQTNGAKEETRQRSINLTLSSRGIAAIQAVDSRIVDRLLQNTVPLRGRMVHYHNGDTTSQQYDMDGQCLYSIERGRLNVILLEEAGLVKNVDIHFLHRVQSVDFDNNNLDVHDTASGRDFNVKFDLCIGADGSHSVIRRYLMQATQMEYTQHYLSHEYIEIKMPPGVDSSGQSFFPLDPDHLHVWPRGGFTIVAIPNKNKSFTCALFAPKSLFETVQLPESLIPWFKSQFPDFFSLLGENQLLHEFQSNPRSQLITTKANPYHKGSVVILGDSAHSMVPFYGQGLNCAFEDIRILSILLRKEHGSSSSPIYDPSVIARILDEYSATRHNDLVAISDLAMDNYLKLRHDVATWSYMIKGFVDKILYAVSKKAALMDNSTLKHNIYGREPSGWIPLYTMVSFRPDISYSAAKKRAESQERVLEGVGIGFGLLLIASLGLFVSKLEQIINL
ncbi:FAD/NAD-binding domain-containing protein [Mycena galericulata]|nr:FAD/NAD-binding domain-containing protein [Mycena galericulata]